MKRKGGFTLVELLVTASIIAILLTLAYPGFQAIVRGSRHSDAIAALLKLQMAQERLRMRCAFYAQNLADADTCGASSAASAVAARQASPEGYYLVSIKAGTAGRERYVALAKPAGTQAGDACGFFAVNQDGPVYTHGGSDYADVDCWTK